MKNKNKGTIFKAKTSRKSQDNGKIRIKEQPLLQKNQENPRKWKNNKQ